MTLWELDDQLASAMPQSSSSSLPVQPPPAYTDLDFAHLVDEQGDGKVVPPPSLYRQQQTQRGTTLYASQPNPTGPPLPASPYVQHAALNVSNMGIPTVEFPLGLSRAASGAMDRAAAIVGASTLRMVSPSVLVPFYVVLWDFPLAMFGLAFVLPTWLVSIVLFIMPFLGFSLYTFFAIGWRILAKLDFVALKIAMPGGVVDFSNVILPVVMPADSMSATNTAYRRMRALCLDRVTTMAIIYLSIIKPTLAIINFLYILAVILPLTLTTCIFFIPQALDVSVAILRVEVLIGAHMLCAKVDDGFGFDGDEGEEEELAGEQREVDVGRAEVGRPVEIQEVDEEDIGE
ncbi:hypothetical protein HK101_005827, partial [Irineochytrium annulatum]